MNSLEEHSQSVEGRESTEARLHDLETRIATLEQGQSQRPAGLTIIAFSNDMDKLLAAFTLATGAAAMGMPVFMFFTFWALTAIKRRDVFKGKRGVEWLMTAMLPAGPHRLGVSKWNMFGLGRLFFEMRMRQSRVANLDRLITLARDLEIPLVACEAAMSVMGITESELVDGVRRGGVATCLDKAMSGSVTLFI